MKAGLDRLTQTPRLRPAPPPAPSEPPEAAGAPTLPRDWTSTWLVLLTAVAMSFLAALALAAAAGAGSAAAGWTSELARKATASVPLDGQDPRRDRERLDRALEIIRAAPGVAAAQPLSAEEVDALLAPWLGVEAGDEKALRALPLPALIDIETLEGHEPRAVAETLRAAFAEARLAIEVDAHENWADRLEPAADAVRTLARVGLALIAVAAAAMVALACATALAAQAGMVEVLRLVGASDGFVAGIFVRRFQVLAFIGSAAGAGAGALALLLTAGSAEPASAAEIAPLLPDMTPDPWIWAQLATLPLLFALIATGAAWLACMVALRRAEG